MSHHRTAWTTIFDRAGHATMFSINECCFARQWRAKKRKVTSKLSDHYVKYCTLYTTQQSWARVPAGPSRDACPRSFISSSRSACFFKAFFSRTKIRVPAFQI